MDTELTGYLQGMESRLTKQIGATEQRLEQKIVESGQRLEQKIVETEQRLEFKIVESESRLEQRLEQKIVESEQRSMANTERVETNLLGAFWKWARVSDIKTRANGSSIVSLDERVALVEERIEELDRRTRPPS